VHGPDLRETLSLLGPETVRTRLQHFMENRI